MESDLRVIDGDKPTDRYCCIMGSDIVAVLAEVNRLAADDWDLLGPILFAQDDGSLDPDPRINYMATLIRWVDSSGADLEAEPAS